jgi:uncharacterized membrane protein
MRSTRGRAIALGFATAALTFSTPLIASASIARLPDAIEAYIRPVAGLSNFVLFPWAAFVFAGALIGVVLHTTSTATASESRAILVICAAGSAIAASAFAASYLPSAYLHSSFWHTSPSFFFIRAGVMTAAIGAAYAWQSRPGGLEKWSPLRQMGRSSLFIYWIHVEMVYGLISVPLHNALTLPQALLLFVVFSCFMLGCSIAKDRVVAWLQRPQRRSRVDAGGAPSW